MEIYMAHTVRKNTGEKHIIQTFCKNQGLRGWNLELNTSRFISACVCFSVSISFSLPASRLPPLGKYMLTFF